MATVGKEVDAQLHVFASLCSKCEVGHLGDVEWVVSGDSLPMRFCVNSVGRNGSMLSMHRKRLLVPLTVTTQKTHGSAERAGHRTDGAGPLLCLLSIVLSETKKKHSSALHSAWRSNLLQFVFWQTNYLKLLNEASRMCYQLFRLSSSAW